MSYHENLDLIKSIDFNNSNEIATLEKYATQFSEIRTQSFRRIKERIQRVATKEKLMEQCGEAAAKQMIQDLLLQEYQTEMERLLQEVAVSEALVAMLDARLHVAKKLLPATATQPLDFNTTRH